VDDYTRTRNSQIGVLIGSGFTHCKQQLHTQKNCHYLFHREPSLRLRSFAFCKHDMFFPCNCNRITIQ
jgi:hypothetical protein